MPIIALSTLVSCARSPIAPPAGAGREAAAADLDAFVAAWLLPARVAPPTIDFVSQAHPLGPATVTVTPLRPEDAPWNRWPGPTVRLFNNRAGLLFEVQGDRPMRWVPGGTSLRLNDDDDTLAPVTVADDLLLPLLRAALLQERWALDGDLVDRTRAAGPFRAAWLDPWDPDGASTGTIGFVLPDPDRHVTRVALTLSMSDGGEVSTATWVWD